MQLKEYDVILDIKRSYKLEQFEVVQGDSNSNVINITLYNGLIPFSLVNTTVEVVFSKSDGTTVVQNDIIIANSALGKIICILKTNTIASPGKTVAEVRILEGETLLTSTRFEFYVRKSLINDETIESTNEFPILTQLINEVRLIESQVPEAVLNSLTDLTTYVNGLAGAGRTTETIKGVNDSLVAHKAEIVSHTTAIAREISLVGVQTITLPFKAKSVICLATVPNNKISSNGIWAENDYQRATGQKPTGEFVVNVGIVYFNDGVSESLGQIQNVTNTGFEINWTKTGSPTGTATLLIIASTH